MSAATNAGSIRVQTVRRRGHRPWTVTWTYGGRERIRAFHDRDEATRFATDRHVDTLVHVDRAGWRTAYPLPMAAPVSSTEG